MVRYWCRVVASSIVSASFIAASSSDWVIIPLARETSKSWRFLVASRLLFVFYAHTPHTGAASSCEQTSTSSLAATGSGARMHV